MTDNSFGLRIYCFSDIILIEVAPDTNQGYIIMKRILMLMMIAVCFAISAQTTTNYTVQRGETLASIAQKFGISEAAILETNPNAKQYLVAGMTLLIPSAKSNKEEIETTHHTEISENKNSNTADSPLLSANKSSVFSSEDAIESLPKSKIYFNYNWDNDSNSENKGNSYSSTKSSSSVLEVSFMRYHWFDTTWAVGGGIGYAQAETETKSNWGEREGHVGWSDNTTTSSKSKALVIPIELQMDLSLVRLHAGLKTQIVLSSYRMIDKEKEKTKFDKLSDRFGTGAYMGADLVLGNLLLGADYNFFLSDDPILKKQGTWSFKIGVYL